MSQVTLNPYIFFKGNCREAMEFYKGVFGGDLSLQTYGEAGAEVPGANKEWVMHAMLSGGSAHIMGSDTAQANEKAAKVSLSVGGDDEVVLTKIFEGLSEEGEILSGLKKEFWGD